MSFKKLILSEAGAVPVTYLHRLLEADTPLEDGSESALDTDPDVEVTALEPEETELSDNDDENEVKVAEPKRLSALDETYYWTKTYKTCKTPEHFKNFWFGNPLADPESPLKDGYFVYVWGKENGKYLAAIQDAFSRTTDEYGFSSKGNPFIYLLDCARRQKIGSRPLNAKLFKTMVETNNFIVLLKAFVSNQLSDKDLRGQGVLGSYNIIFSQGLYTSPDILAYLKLQSTIKNSGAAAQNLGETWAKAYTGLEQIPANSIFGDRLVIVEQARDTMKELGTDTEDEDVSESAWKERVEKISSADAPVYLAAIVTLANAQFGASNISKALGSEAGKILTKTKTVKFGTDTVNQVLTNLSLKLSTCSAKSLVALIKELYAHSEV